MIDTLEQRTLKFWCLSRKWNGHAKKRVPTVAALKALNGITEVTYYKRPLLKRSSALQEDIIRGGKSKKPETISSPVAKIERAIP